MYVILNVSEISLLLNENWENNNFLIFVFAPYTNSIKTLFIVPTDAHYYKIIEVLKQFLKKL
jgi:hypothetical protein